MTSRDRDFFHARGFARASSLEMAITFNPVSLVSSGLIWFIRKCGGKSVFKLTAQNVHVVHSLQWLMRVAFAIHNNNKEYPRNTKTCSTFP